MVIKYKKILRNKQYILVGGKKDKGIAAYIIMLSDREPIQRFHRLTSMNGKE